MSADNVEVAEVAGVLLNKVQENAVQRRRRCPSHRGPGRPTSDRSWAATALRPLSLLAKGQHDVVTRHHVWDEPLTTPLIGPRIGHGLGPRR